MNASRRLAQQYVLARAGTDGRRQQGGIIEADEYVDALHAIRRQAQRCGTAPVDLALQTVACGVRIGRQPSSCLDIRQQLLRGHRRPRWIAEQLAAREHHARIGGKGLANVTRQLSHEETARFTLRLRPSCAQRQPEPLEVRREGIEIERRASLLRRSQALVPKSSFGLDSQLDSRLRERRPPRIEYYVVVYHQQAPAGETQQEVVLRPAVG